MQHSLTTTGLLWFSLALFTICYSPACTLHYQGILRPEKTLARLFLINLTKLHICSGILNPVQAVWYFSALLWDKRFIYLLSRLWMKLSHTYCQQLLVTFILQWICRNLPISSPSSSPHTDDEGFMCLAYITIKRRKERSNAFLLYSAFLLCIRSFTHDSLSILSFDIERFANFIALTLSNIRLYALRAEWLVLNKARRRVAGMNHHSFWCLPQYQLRLQHCEHLTRHFEHPFVSWQ